MTSLFHFSHPDYGCYQFPPTISDYSPSSGFFRSNKSDYHVSGEEILLRVLLSKFGLPHEVTKGYLGPRIAQIPQSRPEAQTRKYLEGCSNEKNCSTLEHRQETSL